MGTKAISRASQFISQAYHPCGGFRTGGRHALEEKLPARNFSPEGTGENWSPNMVEHVQNPCWLMSIGDSTTQYLGDYEESRTKPTLGELTGWCLEDRKT